MRLHYYSLILLVIILFSCNNTYSMLYEPGVYVDVETLHSEHEAWLGKRPSSYSYTYRMTLSPSTRFNLIVNVQVKDFVVNNIKVLEYCYKKRDDFPTDEDWDKYLEYADIGDVSLENMFSECDNFVKNAQEDIVKDEYKDCYYAALIPVYDSQYHFIKSCKFITLIMIGEIDGTGPSEVNIENFKVE